MNTEHLIYILIGYMSVREIWFHYTTHKLVNKLMSRNYFDYRASEEQGKITQASSQSPHLDLDPPEDLGTLQGIAM